jgi:hypothetical protein
MTISLRIGHLVILLYLIIIDFPQILSLGHVGYGYQHDHMTKYEGNQW